MTNILLVEDDKEIVKNLSLFLRDEGFRVKAVSGQKDALEQIEEHGQEIDLVLLDVSLEDGNGFAVCAAVKANTEIPVIFLTASGDEYSTVTGLDMGADDYITKPFSASELVARVKAHLSRYERLRGSVKEENQIIEIRGLKIDATARRVWVNGTEVPFTTKEFDLLYFLASHPNHVYTKEELFKEIWKMDSVGDIATVTVHIKKIREKIEMNTAKPQYIETIWGVGYRFKM